MANRIKKFLDNPENPEKELPPLFYHIQKAEGDLYRLSWKSAENLLSIILGKSGCIGCVKRLLEESGYCEYNKVGS